MIVDPAAVRLNSRVRSKSPHDHLLRNKLANANRSTRNMPSLKLMVVLNRLSRRFQAILAVPVLLIIASCGTDDGLGKRYPVSGTVTYNGNPLEKGDISFVFGRPEEQPWCERPDH